MYASKLHCTLVTNSNGTIILYDNSLNGTYINGIRYAHESIELHEHDTISLEFPVNEYLAFILERVPQDEQMELDQELEDSPDDAPQHELEEVYEIGQEKFLTFGAVLLSANVSDLINSIVETRTGNYIIDTLRGINLT